MGIPLHEKLRRIVYYWANYKKMEPAIREQEAAAIDSWGPPDKFYAEVLKEIEMHQEINGRLYKQVYGS